MYVTEKRGKSTSGLCKIPLLYASCSVLYNVLLLYRSTQEFYNKQIITTVIALVYFEEVSAICFGPVGSSSCNHYMSMLLVIGLFTEMDSDQ